MASTQEDTSARGEPVRNARDPPARSSRAGSRGGCGAAQPKMSRRSWWSLGEPVLHVGPVDDVPERGHIVGLHVLVLQVVRVLPHVDLEQRDDAQRHVGLLVVQLEGQQAVAQAVVAQHGPARALQAVGRRGELRAELVERTELVVDRLRELAGGLVATVGGESSSTRCCG